jgi:hypothetical protein
MSFLTKRDGPDPHAPPIAERGLDRLECHSFGHDPSPAAASRASPLIIPAPPVPAASRAIHPPAMDGAHRPSWLAAVEALRCPGPQRFGMELPCPCVLAVAVGGDRQSVRRVPSAAMPRRLAPRQRPASRDARLPQTLRDHPGPRLGRMARPDVRDGGRVAQPSRAVARQPRQPLWRQPRAAIPSARLVGCANTASARTRSVAIRCGPSRIAHAPALVACTTNERMECRARRGTSYGLFHRLLRPPCRPRPARV